MSSDSSAPAGDVATLVWLASYLKSGNTWMRYSIAAAINRGILTDINRPTGTGLHAADRSWFDRNTCVEFSDLFPEEIERLRPVAWDAAARMASHPVLVKIHDQRRTPLGIDLVPKTSTRGILYLVRDPRDLAISWSHHSGASIDQCIATMVDSEYRAPWDPRGIDLQFSQWIGNWSDHCRSWIGEGRPDTLVLRYEDRLDDPMGTLRSALSHVRIDVSGDVLERAVASTRFERMQEMEKQTGFRERHREASAPFFRSARAGDWREILTKRQSARIERDHGNMMARLGYL